MLTVAPPDAAEMRCNATFEALMWAMARPGDRRKMTETGLAPIVETLVDLECAVFADDEALCAQAAATGAAVTTTIADADYVFLSSLADIEGQLGTVRCGSALYPDDGATLVAMVRHGDGEHVRLSGPGIDGSLIVALQIPASFWARREALCAYPEGFDLLLVDGAAVIGIPRSTKVEII